MDSSERNRKLTAITYCKLGAAKHLRETGRLPDHLDASWCVVPMRCLVDGRDVDPVLSSEEQEVYAAILRERKLGMKTSG